MVKQKLRLGTVAFSPKGKWNAETEYKRLNVVHFLASSYYAKKENVGQTPTLDSEYWGLLVEGGDVVNNPDEEDITTEVVNNEHVLKLADKEYRPENYSGKGYKRLRKNIQKINLAVTKITVNSAPTKDGEISVTINNIDTHISLVKDTHNTPAIVAQTISDALVSAHTDYNIEVTENIITLTRKHSGEVASSAFDVADTGVTLVIEDSTKSAKRNILTPAMINQPNTIYEIRYDFDLNGETINVPENCTLKFEGGSLSNGTLNLNNSVIQTSQKEIFNNLNINGSILYFNLSWFKISDYLNSAFYIQQAINVVQGTGGILYIPKGIYYLKPSNDLLYHLLITDSIKIEGDKNETILRRVDVNGEEPKKENYNNIQYGNLISITSNIKKNINVSIKDIVLDGNQNWQHDKFGNLKDKLIRIYNNKNVITNNIIYDNVQFLNNASEAAYNECYVDETKTIFTNCKFVNIGGSAGNSGGNDVLYDNCLFESASIEHSWCGSEHIGLCVIRNCTFHNVYKTTISSNYQQKVTYDIQKGKTLIIENCNFINDNVKNILYNIIIVESSDNVFIKNNTFTNVSYNGNSRILYANNAYNYSKFVNFENNNIINSGFISFEKISSKTNMIIRNNTFYCSKNNTDIYNINKQYNDNNCYIYNLDIKSNTDTTINIPIFINNKIQLILLSADNNSTVNIKLKNINNFIKLDKTFTLLKDNIECIASIEQSYSNDNRRTITINSDIDITLKMIVLESNTIPKNALLDDSTKAYNILINNYAKGDSNNRPTNVNVGTLYKNKETNKWEIFNGTSWENLDGAALTQ